LRVGRGVSVGGTGVAVLVGAGVFVTVGVGVGVAVSVDVGVAVQSGVGVKVGTRVRVANTFVGGATETTSTTPQAVLMRTVKDAIIRAT
jgi:hypothetical protein